MSKGMKPSNLGVVKARYPKPYALSILNTNQTASSAPTSIVLTVGSSEGAQPFPWGLPSGRFRMLARHNRNEVEKPTMQRLEQFCPISCCSESQEVPASVEDGRWLLPTFLESHVKVVRRHRVTRG